MSKDRKNGNREAKKPKAVKPANIVGGGVQVSEPTTSGTKVRR
jgi:hypothetical protein